MPRRHDIHSAFVAAVQLNPKGSRVIYAAYLLMRGALS